MTRAKTDDQRTIILTTRVNPDEHALIIEASRRAGLPPATYLRTTALAAKVTVKTFVSMAPEDVGQLKRLGNLLNQIARSGWRERFTPAMAELLDGVLTELRIALRTLGRERLAP